MTSASTTFTWNAGSGGAITYSVWIGTSVGALNLGAIGPQSGTSGTVTLPANGATIYVRLWTTIDGGTQFHNDYTYTEPTGTGATMVSPTPGSQLTSASTTFTWNAGSGGAITYSVWIGTSVGALNLGAIGPQSGTSGTVTLPANGATIYVRLWTTIDGGTQFHNDYTYTEPTGTGATMVSPTPGSQLTSASTTFTWNAGSGGAITYSVWIGTSVGALNLGAIGPQSGTSGTVTLPANGATIYVRLWTTIDGGTQFHNDYTYTEPTGTGATMISPTPGSQLTSASTTFTWNAGSGGAITYSVWIGTSVGALNLGAIGPQSGTSGTVTLPANGATIYVRLWTTIDGGTQFHNDYTYTEPTGTGATMVSPTPGSQLTSASTTFTWNAGSGGAITYSVWIGTSVGALNLGAIGPQSGTSGTVTLPANGATIYVRLWTTIDGGTQFHNDYTYTEAP